MSNDWTTYAEAVTEWTQLSNQGRRTRMKAETWRCAMNRGSRYGSCMGNLFSLARGKKKEGWGIKWEISMHCDRRSISCKFVSLCSTRFSTCVHVSSSPNATLIRSRRQLFHQMFFGTQLFLFLFDFFEEIGYQKTSGEKIAFST